MKNPFLGKWRIIEMEQWDREYIDLVQPGYIKFEKDMQGSFVFGVVKGWLDGRIESCGDEKRIEFSWEGANEMDDVSGRGWAIIKGVNLEGRIYIHNSDDSWFKAEKI